METRQSTSRNTVLDELLEAPPQRQPERNRSALPASIQSLLTTVVIALFVITFLVQAFQIPSESMEDTLLIGDYLLVDKVHFGDVGRWGHVLPYTQIHRGDVVVFHYPVRPEQHFVKRVLGVPGDHLRISGNRLFVNGVALSEPYALYKSADEDGYRHNFPNTNFVAPGVEAHWWLQMRGLVRDGELLVPPGQYFALGDNRDESLDSRYWGFVPRENIIGRPLVIYWSVRSPQTSSALPTSASDKLSRFGYVLTHLLEATRWDRTLRLVK